MGKYFRGAGKHIVMRVYLNDGLVWSLAWHAFVIQIASEYSKHPKTGLVQFSNGPFVSGCRMVRFSNVA